MQNKSRIRHHKPSIEKADILAALEQSGLSQREFAAQHGIAVSTLHRWKGKSHVGQETGRAGLVEVPNVFGAGPAVCAYRLRFPRGLVLEVAPGFRPDELRALAQLIQNL